MANRRGPCALDSAAPTLWETGTEPSQTGQVAAASENKPESVSRDPAYRASHASQTPDPIWEHIVAQLQDDKLHKISRLAALKRSSKYLERCPKNGISDSVLNALIGALDDPTEICREQALNLVERHPGTFIHFAQVILAHILETSQNERSEEIRLQACNTLAAIAPYCAGTQVSLVGDIISIVLKDRCPEVSTRMCGHLSHLENWKFSQSLAPRIRDSLLPCVVHRKATVRGAACQALGEITMLETCEVEDEVHRALKSAAMDSSARVRLSSAHVVSRLLLGHRDRYTWARRWLPTLLLLTVDPIEDVRHTAKKCLEDCGRAFSEDNKDDLKDEFDFVRDDPQVVGPRKWVQQNLSFMVNQCLEDVANWQESVRLAGWQILRTMTMYAGEHVESFAPRILPALLRGWGDQGMDIQSEMTAFAATLGQHVTPEHVCEVILPMVEWNNELLVTAVKLLNIILAPNSNPIPVRLLRKRMLRIHYTLDDPQLLCHLSELITTLANSIGVVEVEDDLRALADWIMELDSFDFPSVPRMIPVNEESAMLAHSSCQVAMRKILSKHKALWKIMIDEKFASLQSSALFPDDPNTFRLWSYSCFHKKLEITYEDLSEPLKKCESPVTQLWASRLLSQLGISLKDIQIIRSWLQWRPGPEAKKQREACIQHLSSQQESVQAIVLPQVMSLLDEQPINTRCHALHVIGRVLNATKAGEIGNETIDSVKEALLLRMDDTSDIVRTEALSVLKIFAEKHSHRREQIRQGLELYLNDSDNQVMLERVRSTLESISAAN